MIHRGVEGVTDHPVDGHNECVHPSVHGGVRDHPDHDQGDMMVIITDLGQQ